MTIIEPRFQILSPQDDLAGVVALRTIERAARISHRSEDKQTDDSWQRFIQFVVMEKGDWSVTEHVSATVVFRVDRGVTHELVRHRLFSFTQESTRFVNYNKRAMEFVRPAVFDDMDPETRNQSATYLGWRDAMWQAQVSYEQMVQGGFPPQAARSLLPNALAATIVVTGNLRNWRQLFMQRTTKETHPDFKRVMIPLLKEFQARIPIIYDDLEPDQKQSISMARTR